jgi:UDP-N-acetylmuramoyl-L-alanyl-D-glutamate--2,6-diaminopimelate ligase
VATPYVGEFNVANCLAALAACASQGVPLAVLVAGLARAPRIPGRMELVDAGQPFAVVVDYAHTADSLQRVLQVLRPLTPGRLLAVFGSAGQRDTAKRPAMGAVAARLADFFVLTDEDPRFEDRERILRDIAAGAEAAGAREGEHFVCLPDRRAAIAEALRRAGPGDTVLLAGKGHEQCIIYGDEQVPWDERQVAREVLAHLLGQVPPNAAPNA